MFESSLEAGAWKSILSDTLSYILSILLVKLKKTWRESWMLLQQGTQMWQSMAP
jgi:hypothetical protein